MDGVQRRGCREGRRVKVKEKRDFGILKNMWRRCEKKKKDAKRNVRF